MRHETNGRMNKKLVIFGKEKEHLSYYQHPEPVTWINMSSSTQSHHEQRTSSRLSQRFIQWPSKSYINSTNIQQFLNSPTMSHMSSSTQSHHKQRPNSRPSHRSTNSPSLELHILKQTTQSSTLTNFRDHMNSSTFSTSKKQRPSFLTYKVHR